MLLSNFKILSFVFLISLTSCATGPSEPEATPITIQLKGSAVEVQNFIEQKINQTFSGIASGMNLVSANDRGITFQTDCMNVEGKGAVSCSLLLMVIGNSGWDGPNYTVTYRTNEIRGITTVRAITQWCATNIIGKTNCSRTDIRGSNTLLQELKTNYENEVRKL